ncbi:MAG: SUMF1/EgtB/PvdO family nonheme iron enzyme, partial [Planctomicrobium sp.]|nr:SUMF1/EgtB/PvdO family nonheme iron enzyme [Planctomicrobium sp.]
MKNLKSVPPIKFTAVLIAAVCWLSILNDVADAKEPVKGTARQVHMGQGINLEIVFIPPGEFKMGSTAAEKEWAVGQEGGAKFSSGAGIREAYEGEPRSMRVEEGFWMGRTEVTVGQFRRFAQETGYISDAEKPEGTTMCFDQNWIPNHTHTGKPPHPWVEMEDKSWRDSNHGTPHNENFPVVCVSYNDMKAFCVWLTKAEQSAGSLPDGLVYRLPTEA